MGKSVRADEQMNLASRGDERPRVLLVDDEPLVLDGLLRSIHREFSGDVATNAEEGLEKLRSHGPYPVVISDMRMPGMDGAEFLATVRGISPDSTRIILTGYSDMEAALRAVNDGRIFRFLTKPVAPEKLLGTLRESVELFETKLKEREQLRVTVQALEQLDLGTLTAFARAIDAKSAWTAGHSERVTNLAVRIGHALGLSARDLQIIHRGGLLHDIGKIGTPQNILDHPGSLEHKEMQMMRDHVKIGVHILEPVPCFREVIPIVAEHHEWFDGSGYPAGLARDQISVHARVMAVADCYDAIVSDRPYRKGLSRRQALEILRQRSGTQFDPTIIEAFMGLTSMG